MKSKSDGNLYLLQLLGIVVFVLIWFFLSHIGRDQLKLYLASPEETISSLVYLIKYQKLTLDIIATLARTILAFLPAVFFGIILGILIGSNKILFNTSEVLIEFFRSLPATALLPVFILVFGISDVSRIGTAFFISFLVMLINTVYGVNHSSKIRTKVALSMKASSFQIFKEVTIWEILPHIFSGMRLIISISLIIIIITEMVIGPKYGLGIRLLESQQTFRVDNLYAVMITTGMLGFVLNKSVLFFERKIIHWTHA